MNRTSNALIAVGAVVAAAAALFAWQHYRPGAAPRVTAVAPPAAEPAPAPAAAPAPPPEHRIEQVRERSGAESGPVAKEGLAEALSALLGRKAVLSFLQLDDFPRRVAATVDNLARPSAPANLWPVNPTRGEFRVREDGGRVFIDPDNAQRYTPFVLLAESVDLPQAVMLYVRLYPLLQGAYEELGYPGRHFNTRLVEVIDQLLATPQVNGPLEVTLPEVKGPLQPLRPWVLYEFTDPALQSLSAGQKLLLRTGPEHHRRLRSRLIELRALLADGRQPPPPAPRTP